MDMPDPDAATIAQRGSIIKELRRILPETSIIAEEEGMRAYDCDGLTAYRQLPFIVVLPETTEQISKILQYCSEAEVKIVPRGAGTSLSGGALPLADAITLGLGKLNSIREIDYDNRCVVAQPGVTNLAITQAVEGDGYYYAPDPSSQIACTIGKRR